MKNCRCVNETESVHTASYFMETERGMNGMETKRIGRINLNSEDAMSTITSTNHN